MMLMLLAVLMVGPEPHCIRERVDVIETNHFHDEHAKLVFTQRIFWRFNKHECRYEIIAWRMVKPENNHYITGKQFVFMDDGRTLRKIDAVSVSESWTQFDVELIGRTCPKRTGPN